MAIMTTFAHTGDPEAMITLAQEKLLPAAEQAGAEEGHISSTVVRTDDGIMIVNLWDSEADMRRAAQRLGPIARASGLPPQKNWRMYEVLRHAQRDD
jgi:hypothetical protein